MKQLNEKIIDEIAKRLPDKKRTVIYLMDLLNIGKESAYRRLNNQIPFTFEEAITVAHDLDFSIDRMIGNEMKNRVFFDLPIDTTQNPVDLYIQNLDHSNKTMEELLRASNTSIVAALNRMPLVFFPFKTLFKFEYCHYLYSIGQIPLMTQFSDIVITPQMEKLHELGTNYCMRLQNITCVANSLIYNSLINEIRYYHRLKFISKEDLRILQAELLELFAMHENILRTGQNQQGSQYSIYYSQLEIGANCVHYEYDENVMLQIWLYPENSIVIKNNHIMAEIQKRWLEATIRNSTLITKSVDPTQIEILRNVYMQIMRLTEDN